MKRCHGTFHIVAATVDIWLFIFAQKVYEIAPNNTLGLKRSLIIKVSHPSITLIPRLSRSCQSPPKQSIRFRHAASLSSIPRVIAIAHFVSVTRVIAVSSPSSGRRTYSKPVASIKTACKRISAMII